MSALSLVLRDSSDNGLLFWCPGCGMAHRIQHGEGSRPRWAWNGNVRYPTFSPSILVQFFKLSSEGSAMIKNRIPLPPGITRFPGTDEVCHSFVTDGRIQFLGDCTHTLAGQTVDLPPFEQSEE